MNQMATTPLDGANVETGTQSLCKTLFRRCHVIAPVSNSIRAGGSAILYQSSE